MIFQADNETDQLSLTLLISDATQFGKEFPSNIGTGLDEQQRNQVAHFLVQSKYLNTYVNKNKKNKIFISASQAHARL